MTIDRFPRETFKKNYIEKHGINDWIKLKGRYVEFPTGCTLNEVVNGLIKLREKGLTYYYTSFNGTDLFARDTTLENAIMKIHNLNNEDLITFLEKEKKTLEEISQDNNHKLIKKL